MDCECDFDNTGTTHESDCPSHPDRSAVRVVKVDFIEKLEAELSYLKKEIVDLRFLSGDCVDKISIESQIKEKSDLANKLEYELQALKGS